jgi:hypothetical protein
MADTCTQVVVIEAIVALGVTVCAWFLRGYRPWVFLLFPVIGATWVALAHGLLFYSHGDPGSLAGLGMVTAVFLGFPAGCAAGLVAWLAVSKPAGWGWRVAHCLVGGCIGGIGGAGAGWIVAAMAMEGIYLGKGADVIGPAFFVLGEALLFSFVGGLLGLLGGAFCRSWRSRLRLAVGGGIGFTVGLGLAFIGNRVVAANQLSASENGQRLSLACLGSLFCVVVGAVLGTASGKFRAKDKRDRESKLTGRLDRPTATS